MLVLDQFGRLALTPEEEDYKPSADDMAAFQQELKTQLQKMGF